MISHICNATSKKAKMARFIGCTYFSECKVNSPSKKKELQEQKRYKLKSILTRGIEIVIDFSLPDIMKEKDYQFLVKQSQLLYDNNMNAEFPFSLNFAGLHRNSLLYATYAKRFNKFEEIIVNFIDIPIQDSFPNKNIVYLTPDATEALESIDTSSVYVLGGLVDYQVRKNITLMHAKKFNFEARRLPINEFMTRKHGKAYSYSKILTINQVFAILLKYHETKNWEVALPVGVPQRRGYVPRSQS